MDYNILNGGLVLKVDGRLIISDMKSYRTVCDSETEGMFWFMNFNGTSIFYSDQKKNNALCRMDVTAKREELILDKPCYGLLLYKDWLFYINEDDHKIYRCLTNGKSEAKVTDEETGSFILEEDCIFYTTPQGIKTCNKEGNNRETVSDADASVLILIDKNLGFPDKKKLYAVTLLDLNTNKTKIVEHMASASMNTDGRYLYCTNRLNGKSIYRVDPEQGTSLRICGESAEYLHVIDNELFFCINREWHRLPLAGGQYEKIMR